MNSQFAPPYEFDLDTLVAETGGKLRGSAGRGPWRLTTDSRLATEGVVFVALRGERFDGHEFVPDVLGRPGTGAIVAAAHPLAAEAIPNGGFLLVVPDPLAALGDLARHVRRSVSKTVVGLTGSSGKTTTKEMIASIFAQAGPGLATRGNFNNLVGLPLTLLQLQPEHRWVVLEMGMSRHGEIRGLARVAEPNIRLITNIAPAHLENFEDLVDVARAKGELFENAGPGDLLVTNADDPYAARFPRPPSTREIRFGANPTADVRVVRVEPHGDHGHRATLSLLGQQLDVTLALPGRHNVENAAAATAVAWAAGAPLDHVVAGLAAVELPAGRMAAETIGGVLVLDDSYNANPRSTVAALRTLTADPGDGRRIAVLGDMLELGDSAGALHRDVGKTAAELGVDLVVAVGPLSWNTMEGAVAAGLDDERAIWRGGAEEAGELLAGTVLPGDRVLVKGSRGMRMERVVAVLKERLGC